jgi:hypothetical protein
VVTLMWLGTVALLAFDPPRGLSATAPPERLLAPRPWVMAGIAIIVFYGVVTALHGGVYRPRGFEPDVPAFWALPALFVFPGLAWWADARAGRRAASEGA